MMPTSRPLVADDRNVVVAAAAEQRHQLGQMAVDAGHLHLARHDLADDLGLGASARPVPRRAISVAQRARPAAVARSSSACAREIGRCDDADDAAVRVDHRQGLDAVLRETAPRPAPAACCGSP